MDYVPTTWPGARLPHVWLDDGTALQDRIGDGYTLLRSAARKPIRRGLHGVRRLRRAAAVLDIPDERPRDIYGYDLLLLRPDMHVVWRGNAPPDDAEKLVRMVTGN